MARRVPVAALAAAALVLALTSPARSGVEGAATVLVRYGFDDGSVATGPDTFAVFRAAHGRVGLTSAFRVSGYRAVEISDAAGNGDFSELQGYFPEQRSGHVFAHFALLTARPEEELNVALAGPRRFQLGKDGIAFWLSTREGRFVHMSDSIPKKLAPVRGFVWYTVDVAYDVMRGRYDLTIREEGSPEPLVSLRDQPGASSQTGSAVDVFSFISDPMEDLSEVTYYVDDVVIATSREVTVPPLVAPGRRKLFVDAFAEYRRLQEERPRCLPSTGLDELGLTGAESASQRALRLLEDVLTSAGRGDWRGALADESAPGRAPAAAAQWRLGCAALESRQAAAAYEHFEQAALLAPGGRIYGLNAAVALLALGRLREAEGRLEAIAPAWGDDPRHAIVAARLAAARGDTAGAREALRRAAETGDPAAAAAYYSALTWDGRWHEARDWAVEQVRLSAKRAEKAGWLERAGDAAFHLKAVAEAKELYDEAWAAAPGASVMLKLSDVAFVLGDLESERRYRETYYGTLEEP
jgi:tetratricopeptide (TPR) repeat protein